MPLLKAPLSTSGAKILDADGNPVRLAGVNWGGAQQDGLIPAGLDQLHRDAIAGRIAGWGLNHVRFPFSVWAFMNQKAEPQTAGISGPALAANPDLDGKTPWEIYQACVTAMTDAGLAVIPNQHLLWAGWCCSEADCNGLWYNGSWPATTFVKCWQLVAEAFAGNPLVIGYDLHNEPRTAASINGKAVTPTWGDGNAETDMRLCYANTISAIKGYAPKLWFCEGLQYASDLTGARAHPVGEPGTVYSMHDYAWFHTQANQTQEQYDAQMDAAGGYLVTEDQAPLWIGEFGASTDIPYADLGTGWMGQFLAYAQARELGWCWWELSATAVKGTEPTTNKLEAQPGVRENYGLCSGHDWGGSQTAMLAKLAPLM